MGSALTRASTAVRKRTPLPGVFRPVASPWTVWARRSDSTTDRGLVYRPTRGTYDFALPLFGSHSVRRMCSLSKATVSFHERSGWHA